MNGFKEKHYNNKCQSQQLKYTRLLMKHFPYFNTKVVCHLYYFRYINYNNCQRQKHFLYCEMTNYFHYIKYVILKCQFSHFYV